MLQISSESNKENFLDFLIRTILHIYSKLLEERNWNENFTS